MVKETKKDSAEQKMRADAQSDNNREEGNDLLARLEEAERKAAETYDKYLRALADLDNYKKRAVKEKAEAIAYGNEALIRDVLPILDSLERATEPACSSTDLDAFKEGFQLVKEQLLFCLGKHGVEKIESVGSDFDPTIHHALMHVESENHEDSKVVEEFEKGYLLKGRLLKPAKVSVSRAPRKENNK